MGGTEAARRRAVCWSLQTRVRCCWGRLCGVLLLTQPARRARARARDLGQLARQSARPLGPLASCVVQLRVWEGAGAIVGESQLTVTLR